MIRRPKLSLFKKQVWVTPEYKRQQRKHIKFIKDRASQSSQEREMFEVFKEIAEQDFIEENQEKKFRFWHLEKMLERFTIDPRPHIKMIYGKKNIGKTWELARKIARLHNEDPNAEFVIVRNKAQDKDALTEMFKDEIWPIEASGNKIYWKDSSNKKRHRKQAGLFVWATAGGFQMVQGSSFKNIKLIVWDECNDTDGSALTPATLYKFYVFTSSIIRDKGRAKAEEAVETYMIGNLLSKGDETMNIFLSRLHVDPTVSLKIIDIHQDGDFKKPVVSRLLYLNTLDFYEGIEKQVGLAGHFITDEEQSSLLMNVQKNSIQKSIYSEWDLYKALPQFSIVFSMKEDGVLDAYILYIARVKKSLTYIAWVEKFRPQKIKLGYRPFTNDLLITCNYVAPIFLKENQFRGVLKVLAHLLLLGQLFYGYNNSQQLFGRFWTEHEPLYTKASKRSQNGV